MRKGQVLVIDSLMSPNSGKKLLGYLRQIIDKPPTYLINTHNHGDHVFGNQVFSPSATIIAHENAREELLLQEQTMVRSFAERYSNILPDIKGTILVAPYIIYRAHMTLHFAGRTVKLINPGVAHTNGDTMVYLPQEKILYAGDILFNNIFPPIFGSRAGWIAAIEHVEMMDIEAIVPGHGFIATDKELMDLKQCLIELRRQAKDCFNRGLCPTKATKEIRLPCLNWPHTERLALDVEVIYEELMKDELGRAPRPK